MAINIILIVMATAALVYGFDYVCREKRNGVIRQCMLANGILTFLWNFGYGMMGLCDDYTICYWWRGVALFGVCGYLLVEFLFVRHVTGTLKKHFAPIMVVLSILGTTNFLLVVQPSVVTFFPYAGRTAYSSNPVFARVYQACFLTLIIMILVSMAIYWWFRLSLRREKEIVILLFCSHFSLVFAMIPDTVLPTLGYVSIPTSGIGAFACYVFTVYVADRLSAFELSANSMNDYIYHNVDNSVLFFDTYGKLIMSNEFALKFFGLDENARPYFYELFQVSKEKAEPLLHSDTHAEGIKLTTTKSNTVCSVILSTIRDKYNEPMYTACFVYDLTKEERMYQEVNALKQQLQIDLEKKTRQMERLTLQSIATIANTIDAKDVYTKGHSERVAAYSVQIAEALGWHDNEIQQLRNAALLHDIGKIGVADAVLNKDSGLTDEEYEELKQHTVIGGEILKDINMIPDLDAGALYHHERYDGKGYPAGLSGEHIPLSARIIAVADSFDAMNTKRVYRDPLSKNEILAELKKNRGTQFDPKILDVFLELYEKDQLANA